MRIKKKALLWQNQDMKGKWKVELCKDWNVIEWCLAEKYRMVYHLQTLMTFTYLKYTKAISIFLQ